MTVFLQNALGFFIQFFPCALMIILPFPQESLRFKRKNIILWTTVFSVIFAILFSSVLCFRDISKYPKHIIISNSFMLATILIELAMYIWLVRESLMKKVMVFFIVLFYAVTEFVMVNTIHSFLYPLTDTTVYTYTESFLLLYAVTTALMMPLMFFVVIRPLKEYIQNIEPKNMRREFLTAVISTFIYFIMTIYCDTVIGKIGFFQYFLPPMFFLTINQMLIYWLIFRESVRRKNDSERQKTMEIQQLQYEKIVGDMENTRRMRHDLRHHYNSLNDMLDRGQLDEMKDYLSKVIDTTVNHDNEIYCKNITVNGLLQYYVGIAREYDIHCEVHAVCDELNIESVDLTVLFGNAMENAINACCKCSDNRWINVQVGIVQGSFAIEISNSCKGVRLNRQFQTEDGFSPAETFLSEHSGNGYGLRSIAHTAQKYDGSASFRFNAEKEIFTSRIRLNMHTDI